MTARPTRIALHQRVTTALGTPNVLMGTLPTGLTQVGGTPNFDFSYVDALGQRGVVLLDELKNGCEKDFLALAVC